MSSTNQDPQEQEHVTNEPFGPAGVVESADGIVVITGAKDASGKTIKKDGSQKSRSTPEAE